jgi:hypothetical protein
MSSNHQNRNQYHGPANFQHFLRPILLLMDNSRLQMDLESRFVIKPAPRTDKEVLIKSAVIRRIMIPIKKQKVHDSDFERLL